MLYIKRMKILMSFDANKAYKIVAEEFQKFTRNPIFKRQF